MLGPGAPLKVWARPFASITRIEPSLISESNRAPVSIGVLSGPTLVGESKGPSPGGWPLSSPRHSSVMEKA